MNSLKTLLILTLLFGLSGCGSTKVYEAHKTIVYRGEMYNVSDVSTFSRKVTGKLSNDEVVNLRVDDKKGIQKLLKDHGEIYVRMAFMLDDRELLYRASQVDRWGDFQSMARSFDKAGKDIAELMAESKATQIELK